MKRLKIIDEHILLAISVMGIVLGFIPLYKVNGDCYVSLMSYCQAGTPVYIDLFEKLRLAYIPFFFVSVVALVTTLPAVVPKISKNYMLHIDIKFMLTLAIVFAQIPLLSFNIIVSSASASYSTVISDIVVSVDMNIEKLPSYYILSINGVSPILVLAVILLAHYLVNIIITVTET